MSTGLEINFDEEDYFTDEDDITGLSGISLGLREAQAPFRMELIPATISEAESAEYDLTDCLSLDGIDAEQHEPKVFSKPLVFAAILSHVGVM